MLTSPWSPDPRLDRDPRCEARRLPRPVEAAPTCSCGCRSVHEVARRTLTCGGRLVVMSDGQHRVWARGQIAPDVVWLDRHRADVRRVVEWASVYDAREVLSQLVALG